MRFLFKLLFWSTLLGVVSAAGIAWFSLEQQPLIRQVSGLSHTDIARAKRIIKQNDPRRKPAGTVQVMRISEQDLNLAVNYLLQRVARMQGAVSTRTEEGKARVAGSVRIPELAFRPYLNVSLTLTDAGGSPQISDMRIGQLDIPDPLAHLIIENAIDRFSETKQWELAGDIIKEVEFAEKQLAVSYLWKPGILAQARDTLIQQEQREAIAIYYNELASLHAGNKAQRGSLTGVLQHLFSLAQRRTQSGQDPVEENRALLLVLGSWAMNQGMGHLLSHETQRRRIRAFRLVLNQRRDLAQHFMVSAAIASNSDTMLADAVGLYKEVQDSQGGSGFSFADLAADRAGTRFGEEATQSESSARRIQQLLSSGVAESDIMPRSGDLPEHLNAKQFKRRYGEIGSPDYNRVAQEIERRVAACSIYRGS
jgi:uncharacterized protein YfiM (DUF2279 family)